MCPAPTSTRDDESMRLVYVLVVICHTAVILSLWIFGRVFSN
jgi:hypothetical protein